MTHETVTWADLLTGDRILVGPVGSAHTVLEVARQGPLYASRVLSAGQPVSPWSDPVRVPPDLPAARLYRDETSVAVATLRAGGLDVEIIT